MFLQRRLIHSMRGESTGERHFSPAIPCFVRRSYTAHDARRYLSHRYSSSSALSPLDLPQTEMCNLQSCSGSQNEISRYTGLHSTVHWCCQQSAQLRVGARSLFSRSHAQRMVCKAFNHYSRTLSPCASRRHGREVDLAQSRQLWPMQSCLQSQPGWLQLGYRALSLET
jgi:hypothetical protein